VTLVYGQNSYFGNRVRGQATFYGAGADSGGTCMYNNPKYNPAGLPTVAIGDFGNAQKCGMCVMIYPLGTGAGNSDFPQRQPFMALVNNQCPECGPNNLDIAQNGDGRWDIEWEAVDCPVNGNIQLQLKTGSSIWHTEISARNFKVPISTISYMINNQWQSLPRQSYNYFVLSNAVTLPVNVQLTSIFGESFQLTLTQSDYAIIEPGLIDSKIQFKGYSTGSNPPSIPPTNPPANPTAPIGNQCDSIKFAHDPSNLYWIELIGPPSTSAVTVQCNGRADSIPCDWSFNVKFTCNPNGACEYPRYVQVDNDEPCLVPQSAFQAAAQASESATLEEQSGNSSGLPPYASVLIAVGVLAFVGVIVFAAYLRARTKVPEMIP